MDNVSLLPSSNWILHLHPEIADKSRDRQFGLLNIAHWQFLLAFIPIRLFSRYCCKK